MTSLAQRSYYQLSLNRKLQEYRVQEHGDQNWQQVLNSHYIHAAQRVQERYNFVLTDFDWERLNWMVFRETPECEVVCVKDAETTVYDVDFKPARGRNRTIRVYYSETLYAVTTVIPITEEFVKKTMLWSEHLKRRRDIRYEFGTAKAAEIQAKNAETSPFAPMAAKVEQTASPFEVLKSVPMQKEPSVDTRPTLKLPEVRPTRSPVAVERKPVRTPASSPVWTKADIAIAALEETPVGPKSISYAPPGMQPTNPAGRVRTPVVTEPTTLPSGVLRVSEKNVEEIAIGLFASFVAPSYSAKKKLVATLTKALKAEALRNKPLRQPRAGRPPKKEFDEATFVGDIVDKSLSKLVRFSLPVAGVPMGIGLVFRIANTPDHPLYGECNGFVTRNRLALRQVVGERGAGITMVVQD